jgi:hypothetical protein
MYTPRRSIKVAWHEGTGLAAPIPTFLSATLVAEPCNLTTSALP